MRYGEDRAPEGGEVFLQPEQRFDVEVVGRLVENKQLGLLEEETAELQPRLFAARHGGDALIVKFGKAHAVQHGADADFVTWIGKTVGELDIRKKYNINIMAVKSNGKINMSVSTNTLFTNNITLLVLGEYKAIQKCFHI